MSKRMISVIMTSIMVLAMAAGCAAPTAAPAAPAQPAAPTQAPQAAQPTMAPAVPTAAMAAPTTAAVVPTTAPAAPAAKKLKVFGAFATPIEEPWDGAINQALTAAKNAGEIDYTFTDNIGTASDMERILRQVADQQKPDLIMGDAFGSEAEVRRVAADYPNIAFAFGSSYGPTEPNVSVFDNWIQEPAYLCGMLAGGLTKTNKIGIVAAMPIPEVDRLINAFIEGAKKVNPKASIMVSYINNFFDPATAKEDALAQINAGVDILYGERDGVIEAATQHKLWVFGNMVDQNSLAPDYVLTGPVWNMTPTVEYLIKEVESGNFTAQDLKDFSMMEKGGASLAPFHGLDSKIPADLLKQVTDEEAAIKSGADRIDINEAQPKAVN
ncbi:MAG TPA: BMP family protein [Anaerolineaceae bacterium]|nr:BMP family protein [Anaerolineaceae bacterium]